MSSSVITENFKFIYNKNNKLKTVQYKPASDVQLNTETEFINIITSVNNGNIKTSIPLQPPENPIINTNGAVLPYISDVDANNINKVTNDNGDPIIQMPIQFEIYQHKYITKYHRSGWKFVVDILSLYKVKDKTKPYIIFDPYMDETFLSHKNSTISPYRLQANTNTCKGWIGILHHPPISNPSSSFYSTNFSANNVVNNTSFQIALKNCKGIIVLSSYLKDWLEKKLNLYGFSSIPVRMLYHPTEIISTEKMFNLNTFWNLSPVDRYITQIGGWLRNSYSIYALPVDNNIIQKAVLKGPGMDIYFKPSSLDFKTVADKCLYNDFVMQISSNYDVCDFSGLVNKDINALDKINLPNFDLRQLGLKQPNSPNIDFKIQGLKLPGLNISEIDVSTLKLSGLNISGIDISELDSLKLRLLGLNLLGLNISEIDLSEIDLSGINTSGLNISNLDLITLKLLGLELPGGINISEIDLSQVYTNALNISGLNISNLDLLKLKLLGIDIGKLNISEIDFSDYSISGVSGSTNISSLDLDKLDTLKTLLENLPQSNISSSDLSGLDSLKSFLENLPEINVSGSDISNASLLKKVLGKLPELKNDECSLTGLELLKKLLELSLPGENISGLDIFALLSLIINYSGIIATNILEPNKYIVGMINYLEENDKSVKIIDYLNNDDYDLFLTKNIVFLNLIDASACNTIIECMVRCTPIIINKIDPVVEYLGDGYPLYYTNMAGAVKLMNDLLDDNTGLLLKTIIYLTNMSTDNKNLYIKTFLNDLNKILLEINFN